MAKKKKIQIEKSGKKKERKKEKEERYRGNSIMKEKKNDEKLAH